MRLCVTRNIAPARSILLFRNHAVICSPSARDRSLARLHDYSCGRPRLSFCQATAAAVPSPPHVPVLLDEILHFFSDCSLRTFVDGTLGAGGHSEAVLAAHPELQQLLGIDVDPDAHQIARARLEAQKAALGRECAMHFARANYSAVKACLSAAHEPAMADGILLDLGVSSMQMDTTARGFSFSRDGPLDMRMGPSAGASAETIVNTAAEAELARIFREYGEERAARRCAARIVDARSQSPIRTTRELVSALGMTGGPRKGSHIHPATRVFQALRIAVNAELQHLEAAVPACIDSLASGGRLAVVSFHSLEDRIVKHAFLRASGKPAGADAEHQLPLSLDKPCSLGQVVTRRPVVPSESEQSRNPRSRSAKLRVFQRM